MGDGLAYLIIGFATAFNILVIKFKIERKRYADGIFDAICLMLLAQYRDWKQIGRAHV